jgi:Flp pilus assembly protein TadD
MSLIIDALKRAQQLRLKGPEGTPTLRYPHPDNKRRRNSKKQWIFIGAGLISFCIVLFILLRPTSPPLAIQTHQATFTVEKKPSLPVGEIISPESQKEVVDLPKDEKPLSNDQTLNPSRLGRDSGQAISKGLPYVGAALSTPSSHPTAPPPPPVAQKEEVPSKSIGVEQEGGKDPTLTSDVLNHFNEGVHFFNQKEFTKAIQTYQKVIELDPTYVEAYNNLGITYQTMGDMDKAFKAYEKAIEIDPRYEKGYNNLGILLFLKDHYDEALEAFQKALVINSNNIESHINLGVLFKKRGQMENAIDSYQTALAIDPFHKETHYNIALLHEQMENFELAVNHYQQFIQLSQKSHPELVSKVQRHLNSLMKVRYK